MVWEGREAVAVARAMMGVTDSAQAAPGTIRGDFSLSKEENVVHGSDGAESAAREIGLFFREDELV
jgi:nucleoside-diphosphate kinase